MCCSFVAVPDQFHKAVANAGGMYVELELFPDAPTHDALGLTRIHSRACVARHAHAC